MQYIASKEETCLTLVFEFRRPRVRQMPLYMENAVQRGMV